MLELLNISKTYKLIKKEALQAVKNASFTLQYGETLGLIGDSGSGKSTIGQIISGLIKPTSGQMFFKEKPLHYPVDRRTRKQIQILFQHPEISFNPCLKIIQSLKEPYKLYRKPFNIKDIIGDIEEMSLREEHLYRYPRELSGGEIQRLALARILSVNPSLIILDEPTSMLDAVSQAQIIGLLRDYQKKHNTSYLFITHNLSLAKQFSNRILHIADGNLTEQ